MNAHNPHEHLQPSHPQASINLFTSSDLISAVTQSPTSKKASKWTPEEDEILRKYVPFYNGKHWKKISEKTPGKNSVQCLHRWTKILKPGLIKGPWTPEEDQKLIEWVQNSGPMKWAQAASVISGRSGKQCRERWLNNLNPEIRKGEWSFEEDETIFKMYGKYGSSWSKIAKCLKGRTENAIKNRFYSALRRIAVSKHEGDEKNKDLLLDDDEEEIMIEKESRFHEKSEENEGKKEEEYMKTQRRLREKDRKTDKENDDLNFEPLEDRLQVKKRRRFDRERVDMSEPISFDKGPSSGSRSGAKVPDFAFLGHNYPYGDLSTVLKIFINSIMGTITMASTLTSRYRNEITSTAVQGSSLMNTSEAGTKIRTLLSQLNGLESWQSNAQDQLTKLQDLFFDRYEGF